MQEILVQESKQAASFVWISFAIIVNILDQPALEFLDENSPFPSPLPSNTYQQDVHHQSKAPVPKLDLSKAKHIQEQYAKKLTQPQQQNYNGYNADAMSKIKQ